MDGTMNASDSSLSDELIAKFGHVDYCVFGALLSCSVAIGLYFGIFERKKQTTEEYLHGGHQMQVVPIAISLVTSIISAWTIMAVPAEVYSYGWQYILMIPAMFIVTVVANTLFIPVFYQNSIDNCYAYLEIRFSKSVRDIVSTASVLYAILYMPITLYLPSLAFAEVSGHNVHAVNAIVCCCCVTYTMLGGIKAVVWTDVVQGGVMVLSIVLIAFFGVQKVGGASELWDRAIAGDRVHAPDFSLDLTTRQTFWNMVLGNVAIMTWNICFDQKSMQRIIALPSLSHARRSIALFAVGMCFIVFLTCTNGIVMYAYYYKCDPVEAKIVRKVDEMMPHFVEEIVGNIVGMPGIFISCVFSASLSTVSVALNMLAGILYTDFIRPLKIVKHSERNANRIMKMSIALLGVLSVLGGLVIEKLNSSFQAIFVIAGMCNGAIVGAFTLGMLYPWANRHGVQYGVLLSMTVMLFIIINTQIATRNGDLTYESLPTSIEACNPETISLPVRINRTSFASTKATDDGFAFYKIAFMHYGPLGTLLTWIFGVCISYVTGGQDLSQLNLSLLSPGIKYLLPKRYHHTQLQPIMMNRSADGQPISKDNLLEN